MAAAQAGEAGRAVLTLCLTTAIVRDVHKLCCLQGEAEIESCLVAHAGFVLVPNKAGSQHHLPPYVCVFCVTKKDLSRQTLNQKCRTRQDSRIMPAFSSF